MFYIERTQTVELNLTTPVQMCCNCGSRKHIELVETPLSRSRFYVFLGTELTLLETYPYCPRCKASATRTPPNAAWKLLMGGFVFGLVMIYLMVARSDGFKSIGSMMGVAALIASLVTVAYYGLRSLGADGRSYYQPVRLLDARMDDSGGGVYRVALAFTNRAYAREMARGNAELIRSGRLKIES